MIINNRRYKSTWVLVHAARTQGYVAFYSEREHPNNPTTTNPYLATWYESRHHAESSLTFAMKHQGFIAQHFLLQR